jgi:hypothetical protein
MKVAFIARNLRQVKGKLIGCDLRFLQAEDIRIVRMKAVRPSVFGRSPDAVDIPADQSHIYLMGASTSGPFFVFIITKEQIFVLRGDLYEYNQEFCRPAAYVPGRSRGPLRDDPC